MAACTFKFEKGVKVVDISSPDFIVLCDGRNPVKNKFSGTCISSPRPEDVGIYCEGFTNSDEYFKLYEEPVVDIMTAIAVIMKCQGDLKVDMILAGLSEKTANDIAGKYIERLIISDIISPQIKDKIKRMVLPQTDTSDSSEDI